MKPKDVFAERVPFFEPYKIYVEAEATVAAGLNTLGRRVSPEIEDYVDFLRVLSVAKNGKVCSEREQAQAISALEQAGKANSTNINDDNIPVLTQTGRMLPLEEVFKMDVAFWSKRFADTDVEFMHVHITAPRILKSVRRISEAAQEVLEAEPLLSRDRSTEALCLQLQSLIRSNEFSRALVRLASDECGHRASYNPNFADWRVCAAVEIRTVLELERNAETLRIGSSDVDFFVDVDSKKVWIATRSIKGVRPKMAKAINRLMGDFGLRDLSPLEAILRVRKEEISSELDDRGIMSWDLPERRRPDWSVVPEDSIEPADDETGADAGYAEAEEGFERDTSATVSPETPGTTVTPEEDAAEGEEPAIAGERATRAVGSHAEDRPGTSAQRIGSERPLVGSRNPPTKTPRSEQSSERPTDSLGRGTSPAPEEFEDVMAGRDDSSTSRTPRGRYVTYVVADNTNHPLDAADPPAGSEAYIQKMEIGRFAVARVVEFERSRGHVPREMPHLNPGYDVESQGPSGDVIYIEVKGRDGPWDAAGVGLTATEFSFAQKRADSAWLYIVEFARDDDQAKIYRIQNPANKVTMFCFDQGWRAAGEQDPEASLGPPARAVRVSHHGSHSDLPTRPNPRTPDMGADGAGVRGPRPFRLSRRRRARGRCVSRPA
jgi:hypothetical protein